MNNHSLELTDEDIIKQVKQLLVNQIQTLALYCCEKSCNSLWLASEQEWARKEEILREYLRAIKNINNISQLSVLLDNQQVLESLYDKIGFFKRYLFKEISVYEKLKILIDSARQQLNQLLYKRDLELKFIRLEELIRFESDMMSEVLNSDLHEITRNKSQSHPCIGS